jgi:hypothetical protein
LKDLSFPKLRSRFRRLLSDLTKAKNNPEVFFASNQIVNYSINSTNVIIRIYHAETDTALCVIVPEKYPFDAPLILNQGIIQNGNWSPCAKLLQYIDKCRSVKIDRKNILIGANNMSKSDMSNAISSGYDVVVDNYGISEDDLVVRGIKADFSDPEFWKKTFEGFRTHFPDPSIKIYRIAFDWSVHKFVPNDKSAFYGNLKHLDVSNYVDRHSSLYIPYGAGFVPGYVYCIGSNGRLYDPEDKFYAGLFVYDKTTHKINYSIKATLEATFLREFSFLNVVMQVDGEYKVLKIPFNKAQIIRHNTRAFASYGFTGIVHHKKTPYPVDRADMMQREIKSFYELKFA